MFFTPITWINFNVNIYCYAAYNSAQTIERTVKSIDLDNNKFKNDINLEVIIDDGIEKFCIIKKIVKKYKDIIFLEHKENKGMCAARNTGIKNTKGNVGNNIKF